MRQKPAHGPLHRLVIVMAALATLILGYYLGSEFAFQRLQGEVSARLLKPPRDLPDFQLLDQNGEPFTRQRLEDHWSFVYFGCIECPDSRVAVLALLAQVYNRLADWPALQQRMLAVFVTTRPDADTPALLKQRIFYYHPEFVGVTGEPDRLEALADAFPPTPAPEPGDVAAHLEGSPLYLVGPDARLLAVFHGWVDAAGLAADLRLIVETTGLELD
jgi:protein SCO1/2